MLDWSNMGARPSGGTDKAVRVNVVSQEALLADLAQRFRAHEGFSVATLNLDHAVKLGRDPAFRAAYRAHTHVTADGKPVVWLARLSGQRVGLVAGSDEFLDLGLIGG